MKIRLGFVSNSSSSCFILTLQEKDIEKKKVSIHVIEDIMSELAIDIKKEYGYLDQDEFDTIYRRIQDCFHPIIITSENRKIYKYVGDEKVESDLGTFLICTGIKTPTISGDKKAKNRYNTFIRKLGDKKAFYIIAGSDANEINDNGNCSIGYFVENAFIKYDEMKNKKYDLRLYKFRF